MPKHRTSPPRQPAAPPANAEEGAAHVRAALVKLFDHGDGTGADWSLMLESLYRAGFKLADDQLSDDKRLALMRRVHEGSYGRMVGAVEGDSGASKKESPESVPAPSNTAVFKSTAPRPPKVGH